jgi:hypothetical protein
MIHGSAPCSNRRFHRTSLWSTIAGTGSAPGGPQSNRTEKRAELSVLERSLHFGPRTCVTTPLRSNCLGFGLSCFCTLKYASSRGRGNVVIPKGFPRSVGRVESRLLGFPCFPYSVISMACFGNAFHKVTITANARFGNRNHLSEIRTIPTCGRSADWKSVRFTASNQNCLLLYN